MREFTDDELQQLQATLTTELACSATIEKRRYGKPGYDLNLSRGGRYLELSFAHLVRISELFGTTHIDLSASAEEVHGGCPTCDYGAELEATLSIWYDAP